MVKVTTATSVSELTSFEEKKIEQKINVKTIVRVRGMDD